MSELTIASWPGYGASHNAFVSIFLDGLAENGVTVKSCDRVEDIAEVEADVLLLHWAEKVFWESSSRWQVLSKMARLIASIGRRRRAAKVVWLVHNTVPHDARAFPRMTWNPFISALGQRVDGFLTLSPGTIETVRSKIPVMADKPATHVWHPAYSNAILTTESRIAARTTLGWETNDRVLGYCGQIRPYKGVEDLVRVFTATSDPDLRLYIAGRPSGSDLAKRLEEEAASDPRVTLKLKDLPAEEFRTALGVCDVIVAPLQTYLHSGSIIHSLSAARPVLTPATPFANALNDVLDPGWMRLYDEHLTPNTLEYHSAVQAGLPDLSQFAPKAVGQAAAAFFRSL
ncbi:MAG: glycosyltransferase [Pseudomonadota bacterium]